jgi:hypothetical protein
MFRRELAVACVSSLCFMVCSAFASSSSEVVHPPPILVQPAKPRISKNPNEFNYLGLEVGAFDGGKIEGGANTYENGTKGDPLNFSWEFATGTYASFILGHDYGVWRLEGEFSAMEADSDRLVLTSKDTSVPIDFRGTQSENNADGYTSNLALSVQTLMINAYYDIKMNVFTPYLGMGLGAARSHIQLSNPAFSTVDHDEAETIGLMNVLLGASYKIDSQQTLSLAFSRMYSQVLSFKLAESESKYILVDHYLVGNKVGLAWRYRF